MEQRILPPGASKPLESLKAIDKAIVIGAAADPKLLQAAGEANHNAIGSVSGANGMTSRADWDAMYTALGRVSRPCRVHGQGCLQRSLLHGQWRPCRPATKIGEAAKKHSDASYPFLKDIDWLSDSYIKPLPGVKSFL